MPVESLEPALRTLFEDGPPLIINKTNSESTVHRRARMDYVGVKKLDARGTVSSESTASSGSSLRALTRRMPRRFPILRDKFRKIQEATAVSPGFTRLQGGQDDLQLDAERGALLYFG